MTRNSHGDEWTAEGFPPISHKQKKTVLYLAGPMTGLPDLNFPAFHLAAKRMRAQGFEVINPAEINPDQHMTWQQCMRTDIAALVFCDGIRLLPGWQNSDGATLEHDIALRLGLAITYPDGEYRPLPVAYHYKYISAFGQEVWDVGYNVPDRAIEWHPLARMPKARAEETPAVGVEPAIDWSAA